MNVQRNRLVTTACYVEMLYTTEHTESDFSVRNITKQTNKQYEVFRPNEYRGTVL